MEGHGEKREVSTGRNGREAESERVVPGRQIIGTRDRVSQCANIVSFCSKTTGRLKNLGYAWKSNKWISIRKRKAKFSK
jgi:hypothetical protein